MNYSLPRLLASLATLLIAAHAHAFEAGWMQIQTSGATPESPKTTVALYYPTLAAPRVIPMGPFSVDAAIGGKPVEKVKALILLSHGISGTELGHSALAQALARNGYLVAALRHPGDNYQDRSLLEKGPERYFDERPRQASRVIDAILSDPAWKARIAADSQGPIVGALGHSAGGYTVLALAGAKPDLSRMKKHCQAEASEDPIFCSLARPGEATPPSPVATPSLLPSLKDERVRAIVAMAPTGVLLTAESLAAVRSATMIYEAELDRFLVPRFHAEWVASNLPAANLHRVPNAWHFAFMNAPSMPIPSHDGDVAANPPGFDRDAFLKQLAGEVTAFFDKTLL
jgi:predicted dienelactone hydrolase